MNPTSPEKSAELPRVSISVTEWDTTIHGISGRYPHLGIFNYINVAESEALVRAARAAAFEEIKPALAELYDEFGCQCGYYDEEDEEGESVMSTCAACFIKARAATKGEGVGNEKESS